MQKPRFLLYKLHSRQYELRLNTGAICSHCWLFALMTVYCLVVTGCSKPEMIQINAHFSNGFVVDSGAPVMFGGKVIGYVADVYLDPHSADFVVSLLVREDVPLYETDRVEYLSAVPNKPGKFLIKRDPKLRIGLAILLKDQADVKGQYTAPTTASPVPPENSIR